jgi:uncharacterized membrane protein
MKLLMSILILAAGVAVGWFYLRRPPVASNRGQAGHTDQRPWRRVGAGICVVLAVMFVAGLYLLDEERRPGTYVVYWLVMMVLILWLCLLALRDVVYTRQMIARWKREASTGLPAELTVIAPEDADP